MTPAAVPTTIQLDRPTPTPPTPVGTDQTQVGKNTHAAQSHGTASSSSSSSSSVSRWFSSPFLAAAHSLTSLTSTNLRDLPPTTNVTNTNVPVGTNRQRMTTSQSHGNMNQRIFQKTGMKKPPGMIRESRPDGILLGTFDADSYVQSRGSSTRNSTNPSRRNSHTAAGGVGVSSLDPTLLATPSSTPSTASSFPSSVPITIESTPSTETPNEQHQQHTQAGAHANTYGYTHNGKEESTQQQQQQQQQPIHSFHFTHPTTHDVTIPAQTNLLPPPQFVLNPASVEAALAAGSSFGHPILPAPLDQYMPGSKDSFHLPSEGDAADDGLGEDDSFYQTRTSLHPPPSYHPHLTELVHARSSRPSRATSIDAIEDDQITNAIPAGREKTTTDITFTMQHSPSDKLPTGSPSEQQRNQMPAQAHQKTFDTTQTSKLPLAATLTATPASSADHLHSSAATLSLPPAPSSVPPAAPPSSHLVPSTSSTIPSVPDLSSFSSSNFDDENDSSSDDADGITTGLDAFSLVGRRGGGGSGLSIAQAVLPSLPAFLGGRANNAATADQNHFSSANSSTLLPAHDDAEEVAPRNVKLLNFQRLLTDEQADLDLLRKMSWNGIPSDCRALSWKLLVGYLPAQLSRRAGTLHKRREEYAGYLRDFYYLGTAPSTYDETQLSRSDDDADILKQIKQDVPRTSPAIRFFKDPPVQKSLERILYIFAIRHPASGYVQGMNDLATPFYTIFTKELYGIDLLQIDTSPLHDSDYLAIEADTFWCLSYLISGIQDHYTFAQPGIQRMVYKLKELILRIDGGATNNTTANANNNAPHHPNGTASSSTVTTTANNHHPPSQHIGLHAHFERENVQFLHFGFRWMSVLLMRELKLPLILRLWDSYLSEDSSFSSGFKILHVYVCAAFLMRWKNELKRMDFQELIQFLQKLPTEEWNEQEIETLLAQAHVYKTLFHQSPHLA